MIVASTGPARGYAAFLAAELSPGVLRYSHRLALLRAAQRFGVERFEANLLIAALLERGRRPHIEPANAARGWSVPVSVALLLSVECAALAFTWWALIP